MIVYQVYEVLKSEIHLVYITYFNKCTDPDDSIPILCPYNYSTQCMTASDLQFQ